MAELRTMLSTVRVYSRDARDVISRRQYTSGEGRRRQRPENSIPMISWTFEERTCALHAACRGRELADLLRS